MKRLSIVLIIVLLAVASLPMDGRKKPKQQEQLFDVYLLIGQSNMAGRGWLFDSDKDVMDGVFLLNDRDEIEPASQPLNKYSSVRVGISRQAFNLGGPFAKVIHQSTGRPVLLVINARGATSARLWKSDAPPCDYMSKYDDRLGPDDMPQLFSEAVRRAKIACRYGKLKAIIWHQGEADAYEKYAPLWLDKVADIAQDLRYELGVKASEVPFIVGETNHSFKRCDFINQEIHKVTSMIPNSTWVSAEGCNANKDKIHFSRQGLTLLGQRYAEKVLQMVYGFTAAASLAACSGTVPVEYKPIPEPEQGLYTICDFDNRSVEFTALDAVFSVVGNPAKSECDPSPVAGKVVTSSGIGKLAFSLTHPLDFSAGKREVRLKVLAPAAGVTLTMTLSVKPEKAAESRLKEQLKGIEDVMVTTTTAVGGKWEDLSFDMTGIKSNFYQNVSLSLGAAGTWYFDNLVIPDDDLSALSLFQRAAPPMLPDPSRPWMCNSIANPDVLTPEESIDGNWWLYVRGGDGTRAHLGFYTQKTESFNPLGPWDYFEGNPIVPAGWFGDYDAHHAIDPAPVKGDDGKIYLFYKGIDKSLVNRVLIAESADGYTYTKVDKPWKEKCGIADIVKWNGTYYLYVARRIYAFKNLLDGDSAVETEIIEKGGAPDNCDWYSINGGKLFRIKGVDKWFLMYQAGANNTDFPERFHLAWSEDLLHWTKVNNPQPLFTRGARGEWDQGAIWAPAVFEYGDNLYMYYEGWGREGYVQNRDRMYFTPAHSQVGISSCKTEDFLHWCGF